jgi:hypothetical protein
VQLDEEGIIDSGMQRLRCILYGEVRRQRIASDVNVIVLVDCQTDTIVGCEATKVRGENQAASRAVELTDEGVIGAASKIPIQGVHHRKILRRGVARDDDVPI